MTAVYSEIDEYGTIRWCKKGTYLLHREDGPAKEYVNGTEYWYQYGKLHREDGPAIVYYNGYKKYKEYYLNDIYYPDISSDEEWIIFQILN